MKRFSVAGMVVAVLIVGFAGCDKGNEVTPVPPVVENVVPDENSPEYAKAMAESMK